MATLARQPAKISSYTQWSTSLIRWNDYEEVTIENFVAINCSFYFKVELVACAHWFVY